MTIDAHLIDRLRNGDEDALETLLVSHWDGLVQYAYGLLGDWDRAEDVAQGAYVRLWASRDRWKDGSALALLYRIVRNAALDALKAPRERSGPELVEELVAEGTPLDAVELGELERAATEAVEALPPRRREVFRLVRDQGFSYAEIAEITQLSRQTVANHMSLALSDLRVILRPFLPGGAEGSTERGASGGGENRRVESE